FMQAAGMSNREVATIKQNAHQQSQQLDMMTYNQVGTLPSISRYSGSADNTITVDQGKAEIVDLKSNNHTRGLYTFGAWPCEILILTARGKDGKLERIGLAHADAYTEE